MREIIPNLLWLGNARDMRDVSKVLELEIIAVVDLALEEAMVKYPREIVYCRFPLLDGEGNSHSILQVAIQTIVLLIKIKVPTLVACGAGMSRSPAIVATAIALVHAVPAEHSLNMISEHGPLDVAPALWNEVQQCVNEAWHTNTQ
ncbi:dual specificity protein phosphatase family protein [Schlesneria paludicola]|uniref:dual specificity protein phosphatase family protein n=1 Tax=Schlesneria paludicola TaxID=360056 RepID=UPI000299E702|nr:dual specificity protein phosphatase [Schlesneria paludicola]